MELEKNIAANKAFWDNCTDTHLASAEYYLQVETFLRQIAQDYLQPRMAIADIGCGDGAYSRVLSGFCASVNGYELSESLLDIARTKHPLPNGSYSKFDLATEKIDERHSPFDAIFCMGVFSCIHEPSVLRHGFQSFFRALASGGLLVLRESLGHPVAVTASYPNGYYATYRQKSAFLQTVEFLGFTLERELPLFATKKTENAFFIFKKIATPHDLPALKKERAFS